MTGMRRREREREIVTINGHSNTLLSSQSLSFFSIFFSFLLYLSLLLMIPSFSLIFLYFKVLPATKDDPRQRKPDITTAKTHLGWEPKVGIFIINLYITFPIFLQSFHFIFEFESTN